MFLAFIVAGAILVGVWDYLSPNLNGSTSGGVPSTSGIKGTVMAGPTCPVERIPPDPACADKPVATNISVYPYADPTHGVAFTTSDSRGNFSVSLPPGEYMITAGSNGVPYPRCSEATVTVDKGAYSTIAVSCDTGIR
jgi:hypothetical protein